MKRVSVAFLVLALSSFLFAQAQSNPPRHRRPKKAQAAPSVTAEDLKALRDALAAQQQEIQQMRQEMQEREQAFHQTQEELQQARAAATEAENSASTAQSATATQESTVSKLQSDVTDVKRNATNAALSTQEEQKNISEIQSVLSRFRITGDARVRGDSFFQKGNVDRNRARVRLRLGLEGKPNEDFTAGLFVASGALTNSPVGGAPTFADPTSTNETLTGFFEKKAIGFDRGYIIYNPHQAKWFRLTGGKFAYDWAHTDLTFDPDLNPEGGTLRLSYDFQNPVVKNVTLEGMGLLYNEVAGGITGSGASLRINRGVDSNALGGQLIATLQYGPWKAIPSLTILNWNGADSIAQAAFPVGLCSSPTATGCIQQPNTPAFGTPLPAQIQAPFRFLNTNPFTNASRIVGTGSGQTRAFVSGFEYADFILDNIISTPWKRYPLHAVVEYEQNLRARLNVGLAPSKQDKAYWADISIGQQKERHDLQIGYSWWRIEQDAVISQFNESDQRESTNVLQNRIYLNWLLRNNVTAAFTLWTGRALNSRLQNTVLASGVVPGTQEPYLNRLQFDLIYKF